MPPRWDVLGLGSIAVDDLIYVDDYPTEDTKTLVRSRRREAGGQAATALVAAARLGATAAYFGVLGQDELSQFVVKRLEKEGVDCTTIIYRNGARPIHAAVIVVPETHTRTILFSEEGFTSPRPEETTEELITSAKVVLVDHTVVSVGLHAVKLAHAHKIPVVGDFENALDPNVFELMSQVDHLVICAEFASQLTATADCEKMVAKLSSPERRCCVVTAGKRGCWYAEYGGEVQHFPAIPVQVVDTTGCGDVFHGAYAAYIARGESVPRAIEVATITAGIKATQAGGRARDSHPGDC